MININLIACAKCKGRDPLNDLRADKTGKGWVCISCYSLQHPNLNIRRPAMEQQASVQVQGIQKVQAIQNSEKQIKDPIMREILKKYNYQCSACKYKFSRNYEYKGMCPFCGKSNTLDDLNTDLEI